MWSSPSPIVHLELHTGNLARACGFYSRLFGWCAERIDAGAGSYLSIELGALGGGIVECGTPRALWLPYVEVGDIDQATAEAARLGASVMFAPREGPEGWRSVVAAPEGAEVALWQAK